MFQARGVAAALDGGCAGYGRYHYGYQGRYQGRYGDEWGHSVVTEIAVMWDCRIRVMCHNGGIDRPYPYYQPFL